MFDALLPAAQTRAALAHLQSQGVQPGSIVAWLGHNSWDQLAALVACEKIGAVFLPLNWRLAANELALICEHAGAGHLMGTADCAQLRADVLKTFTPKQGPAWGVLAGDLLLVYTSGTTGQPKGAMHTRAGMLANAQAAVAAQGLGAHTRTLSVLPLFHVGGLCIQTLPTLAVGGQVHLQPRFDAQQWFDAVATWRPTTTLLVPAVMKALLDHPRWTQADLSSLEFVNTGSQIVPLPLIEAFHARGVPVAQVYGATETGPVSIALKPADAWAQAGRVGHPALGVQVQLAPNGEIMLKANNLMRGYHRSSEPAFDAEGWFHTGDLARQHPDGSFEVLGRSKELIISGGENIYPAEIEQWVMQSPAVADCAVVGLPHPQWGEVPVLAVVLHPGAVLDHAALQHCFTQKLARFKHPRQVHVVQALPKTALGKVQRAVLAEQLLPLNQASPA
jgi:fatty-acyl-CoA synthase